MLDNLIHFPTNEILKNLRTLTYNDICGNAHLCDVLKLKIKEPSFDKLDNLPNSALNQVTIFNPHGPINNTPLEIKTILRVAFENFILELGASYTETTEITGDDLTFSVLQAKGQKLGYSDGENSFVQMQK